MRIWLQNALFLEVRNVGVGFFLLTVQKLHTGGPSTAEAQAGWLEVQGPPRLHIKLDTSRG